MARIRLENISKTFGRHTALEDLDLDVGDGEFFVLLGPTGAGKTTTLRLIAGLEQPTVGHIYINDNEVNAWGAAERDVALVLQQYSLYPRLTVHDNLAFPLKSRIRNYTPAEIEERIARAAKTLRIEHLLGRKTDRLSGGEMQRVSIGRAIVREPQMRLGATFIFVTHDQVEAMTMGDRIGVLNQGRIIQVGTPHEIYNNPRDTFVASFVGSPAINLFDGELRDGRAVVEPGTFELPLAGRSEGRYTFGIRPEDIAVESGAPVEARVHDVENHGIEKILTLRVGERLLRAAVPARVAVAVEDEVRFGWNADKAMFFDAATGANLAHEAAQPAT